MFKSKLRTRLFDQTYKTSVMCLHYQIFVSSSSDAGQLGVRGSLEIFVRLDLIRPLMLMALFACIHSKSGSAAFLGLRPG